MAALAQRIGLNAEGCKLARAMAATGSASIIGGLLRAVSNKIVATILGPAGVAMLATLQQTMQTAVTAASMNGRTPLVRGISARVRQIEDNSRREFVRSVLVLFVAATGIVTLFMLIGAGPIAQSVGLGWKRVPLIRMLAGAVALTSVYVFGMSLLNAMGAIQRCALLQLVPPAAIALLAYPVCRIVQRGSESVFAVLLVVASAVSVIGAAWALFAYRSTLKMWIVGAGRWWTTHAAREFLAMAGSMALTGLLGSAALLLVRSRVLTAEGVEITGHFDAAWSISMNQANLVLSSMQPYYLPAMARASSADERSLQLTQTLRLASIVGGAVIIIAAAIKPAILGALYSSSFEPGSRYLRWTLVGDYLKVASWILSMPMLAEANMKLFVAADVVAYGTFVLASATLARWTSQAEGTAMAFVLMYAVHLVFCGSVARRHYEVRLDSRTLAIWICGFAAVCGASAIFWSIR